MYFTWSLAVVLGLLGHESAAAKSACKDVKTIVQNGGFETGSLAPWLLLFSAPNLQDSGQLFSYNVTSPGYKTHYAFTVTDKSAAQFVEVDIGQIEVPVCPGRKYKISAQIFITGPTNTDQLLQLYADQKLVAQAPEAYIQRRPFAWRQLSGTFMASSTTVPIQVTFRTTKLVDGQWGVDNVIVTPA